MTPNPDPHPWWMRIPRKPLATVLFIGAFAIGVPIGSRLLTLPWGAPWVLLGSAVWLHAVAKRLDKPRLRRYCVAQGVVAILLFALRIWR